MDRLPVLGEFLQQTLHLHHEEPLESLHFTIFTVTGTPFEEPTTSGAGAAQTGLRHNLRSHLRAGLASFGTKTCLE